MADDRDARITQLEAENAALRSEVGHLRPALVEALEQQTATAEILSLIAASPTTVQPVLDAVAERTARLCDTYHAAVLLVDGDALRTVARYVMPVAEDSLVVVPPSRGSPIVGSIGGRAVIDGRTIHIHDAAAVSDEEYPYTATRKHSSGQRTVLAIPLMRKGVAIGVIVWRRLEVRPFTDEEIALLETFADQAVIAIENARLFEALQDRTVELSRALEQQTAFSEVLRVIASSPTDLTRVLDAIASAAARFTDSESGAVQHPVDGRFVGLGRYGTTVTIADELRRAGRPMPYSALSDGHHFWPNIPGTPHDSRP